MLIYILIGFLALSLVFYCLLGGADFGAGILELFSSRRSSKTISNVIGPVWEANHVWLILAVTILFVGFPPIYSTITLYLHIPILLLLIGIILRGTAFAFMHYDAIQDKSTVVYHWVFNISSVITPLFLGIIAGALTFTRINTEPVSFYEAFMAPWFNGFAISIGIFCICLFAYLAAIFIIGEVDSQTERQEFVRTAKVSQITTVLSGMIVFIAAWIYDMPLLNLYLNSWIAIACLALATISLGLIWLALNAEKVWTSRFLAGIQVFFILFAWFWVKHPVVVCMSSGNHLTFFNSAAPASTLKQLLIALIVGTAIILPGLFILFRTFKTEQKSSVQ